MARGIIHALPIDIRAGTLGGSVELRGKVTAGLQRVSISPDFSLVDINSSASFSGNMSYTYKFRGYQGIGFLLGCPLGFITGSPPFMAPY